MEEIFYLTALGTSWAAYFALHSLLASLRLKSWVARKHPGLMPAYRLLYNLTATLLLLPLLYATLAWDGPWLWRFQGPWGVLADGLALAAIAGFFWSLRYYSGSDFLGLRQWREHAADDAQGLRISPFHRFVRHPWYFFGLVILWTRDMDAARLVTTVVASIYFVVGSRLEEQKLVHYYGDAYRRYLERVPGLLPVPWRALSASEARAIESAGRGEKKGPAE